MSFVGEPGWPPRLATDSQAFATTEGGNRLHGKEGVDGSSPSEGSAKAPHKGAFQYVFSRFLGSWGRVWSRLWSFRVEKAPDSSSVETTGVFHAPIPRYRDTTVLGSQARLGTGSPRALAVSSSLR